ncbi:phosphodiester glycosidase family protein [Luteolibacter sp. LG18]|uniref:phosphodiester glycosidase family protein n=1 Tax=Luteolibacter sp. LG18 TaxID=2819286 RepID=UPI002B2A65C4|nr:hypothetical protein llg_34200 [Luteolibacter sp. LG18]
MKAFLLFCAMLVSAADLHAVEVKEEAIVHAGTRFRVVKLEPAALQVVWKDEKGVPYRTFDKVQARFAREKKTVKFIANAGIFEMGGTPCGLHVENGKLLHPLNTREAAGNFYLKPTAVFSAGSVFTHEKQSASITETGIKAAREKRMEFQGGWMRTARLEVQSGPALLLEGRRHPAFKEGSENKLVRNGVGIDDKGRVVFAITAPGQVVNFWDFAGLFLKLGCKDALFLDGDISQMAVNPTAPIESNSFGAMFVVAE